MPNEELRLIYEQTVYSIFTGEQRYDIKINQPLATGVVHLLTKHQSKAGYILTAWNPRSQLVSETENSERNKQLKEELLSLHCILYDAIGTGSEVEWTPEASFFILGLDDFQVEQLAVKYEQNAYVKIQAEQPAKLHFSATWESRE